MIVYLHEALDRKLAAGSTLQRVDMEQAAIEGAVQRLRHACGLHRHRSRLEPLFASGANRGFAGNANHDSIGTSQDRYCNAARSRATWAGAASEPAQGE